MRHFLHCLALLWIALTWAHAEITVQTSAEVNLHIDLGGGNTADKTYPTGSTFTLLDPTPTDHPGMALVEDPSLHFKGYISNDKLADIVKRDDTAPSATTTNMASADVKEAASLNTASHYISLFLKDVGDKASSLDGLRSVVTRDTMADLTQFGTDSLLEAAINYKDNTLISQVVIGPALNLTAKADDLPKILETLKTNPNVGVALASSQFIAQDDAAAPLLAVLKTIQDKTAVYPISVYTNLLHKGLTGTNTKLRQALLAQIPYLTSPNATPLFTQMRDSIRQDTNLQNVAGLADAMEAFAEGEMVPAKSRYAAIEIAVVLGNAKALALAYHDGGKATDLYQKGILVPSDKQKDAASKNSWALDDCYQPSEFRLQTTPQVASHYVATSRDTFGQPYKSDGNDQPVALAANTTLMALPGTGIKPNQLLVMDLTSHRRLLIPETDYHALPVDAYTKMVNTYHPGSHTWELGWILRPSPEENKSPINPSDY